MLSRVRLRADIARAFALLAVGLGSSCTNFSEHGPGMGGGGADLAAGSMQLPAGGSAGNGIAAGGTGTGTAGNPSMAAGSSSGGTSSGGASSGGASDGSGSDAGASDAGTAGIAIAQGGAAGAACKSASGTGFKLGFYPENKANVVQEVHPFMEMTNTTGTFVALNRITLRYYFTQEAAGPDSWACYWVTGPSGSLCSQLRASFQTLTPSTPSATRYMELSFTAGDVTLDAKAIEVRTGFWASHANLDQRNDYSFDPNSLTGAPSVFPYRDWDHVSMYVDDVLVWGTEPCAP